MRSNSLGSLMSSAYPSACPNVIVVLCGQVSECGEEPVRQSSLGSGGSMRAAIKRTQPWDDIELGPLIGAGSFGKVYRGVWNGAHVAVKARTRPTHAEPCCCRATQVLLQAALPMLLPRDLERAAVYYNILAGTFHVPVRGETARRSRLLAAATRAAVVHAVCLHWCKG